MLKPLGTLDEADCYKAFEEQARALTEAGVDLLVVETQYDLTEASLAVKAVRSVCDLPLVCSFSYDRGTRTMMGVKPAQMPPHLPTMRTCWALTAARAWKIILAYSKICVQSPIYRSGSNPMPGCLRLTLKVARLLILPRSKWRPCTRLDCCWCFSGGRLLWQQPGTYPPDCTGCQKVVIRFHFSGSSQPRNPAINSDSCFIFP